MASFSTENFVTGDHGRVFFPLSSNVDFCTTGQTEITRFIADLVLDDDEPSYVFGVSQPCDVLKDKNHIRRIGHLDPVNMFYLYNFVNSHRALFKKRRIRNRYSYGYVFSQGRPLKSFDEYHDFREKKYQLKEKYEYFIKVDIANCFNSFYHHDITAHVKQLVGDQHGQAFGQFLRESNYGRSINFFPQGYYPAKVVGNSFLSFIERTRELRSESILRFLDDTYFFSDSMQTLEQDFYVLQQLLANLGMFLNSKKTIVGSREHDFDEQPLDDLKQRLLQKRQLVHDSGMDQDEIDDELEEVDLEADELEYLHALISNPTVEEKDVELAITLLGEDEDYQEDIVDRVFDHFPNLVRNLYGVFGNVDQPEEYTDHFKKKLSQAFVPEYELFWIAGKGDVVNLIN